MRKVFILCFGLLLLLVGGGGIILPVLGYLYYREEAVLLARLGFPFFPFFYLPFMGWLLITGGGLLFRRKWAWYSVQTLWVFLLCSGLLALAGFNLLLVTFDLGGAGVQGAGNLGLALLLVLFPLGGLVFFTRARQEFGPATPGEARWTTPSNLTEDQWPGL
ncbi:MAG: hypothetical protein GX081_11765 [Firmicutes bacterium]|nr:hypothetical protein [Bacillota bacterium]